MICTEERLTSGGIRKVSYLGDILKLLTL
jgi:hypothetical protein